MVDVARALGVSHGSVYRHFPSKAALRDAVTEHWLARISATLAAVAAEEGPAPERLRRWLDLLVASKRELAATDPAAAARAVFDATARFHNPTHAPEWSDPGINAAFESVRSLVLRGLGAGVSS